MTKNSLPGWKVKALQDPEVSRQQAEVIMRGPQSLSEAWFLSAMYYKYQIRGTD